LGLDSFDLRLRRAARATGLRPADSHSQEIHSFFDVMYPEVETEPMKFYSISLWHDEADMEKYSEGELSPDKSDPRTAAISL